MLTVFAQVGRWAFALPILPNIQPFSTILILITLLMGTVDGILVSVLLILLTNMILGTGLLDDSSNPDLYNLCF